MAGTIGGFGLQVQFDTSGNLARGALLYVYDANTSTPALTYSDFSLTSVQQSPLEADGSGRLPMFWVDDGNYRARLTTAAGIEIFDEQDITAIGSSSGGTSGSTSQDTTTLFQTGYHIWQPISGTLSGFVRANGLTIGSGSSGATERANSDTQTLFEWYWNNFSDTDCPVTTGRGSTATSDFNANKKIATFDMRGRTCYGLDTMGNSAASIIAAATATAGALGAETVSKTIGTTNLPSHTHGAGSFSVGTSITNGDAVQRTNSTSTAVSGGALSGVPVNANSATLSLASGSVSGTSGSTGSGTALSIATLSPGKAGTWYVKL